MLRHQRIPAAFLQPDDAPLECIVPSVRGAWRIIEAIRRGTPATVVTPQMLADNSAPAPITTPLALVAAPGQWELCQVRDDGALGLCMAIIHIEPARVLHA